jgi:hypothetical protein
MRINNTRCFYGCQREHISRWRGKKPKPKALKRGEALNNLLTINLSNQFALQPQLSFAIWHLTGVLSFKVDVLSSCRRVYGEREAEVMGMEEVLDDEKE